MAKDWKVVIDDTGGPFTGWPSVCSDEENRCVIHRAGFKHDFWYGPSLREAKEIAGLVAHYMNNTAV